MSLSNIKYWVSSLIGIVLCFATYHLLFNNATKTVRIEHVNAPVGSSAVMTYDNDGTLKPLAFTETAEHVLEAVVHIKSTQTASGHGNRDSRAPQALPDPFREFFGDQFFRFENPQKLPDRVRMGTGSGVIINSEGYIVTNNHVVDNADDLEVTLHDNRTYKATVIGTDPSTDLALIQIKARDLPTVPLVDSDEIRIGEWVLAVGNPMGLNSTVTAGIVSAKGRNINILKDKFAVESFIQTDAAINPGNSGGALVNLNGGLIGINTAIASPTGSYSGYGFAVPANIVSKVVEDLLTYGVVQRGVLGIMIRSVDGNLAAQKDLPIHTGVYVDSLLASSAAGAAGVKVGDVITHIDGSEVRTSPELQALIAQRRPGDQVKITLLRNDDEMTIPVTLINSNGDAHIVEKEHKELMAVLGVDLEEVTDAEAEKLEIDSGVRVKRLYAGKIRKHTDMREGFVITKVDGQKVKDLDALVDILEDKKGGVMLEGVYKDLPGTYYYAFGM